LLAAQGAERLRLPPDLAREYLSHAIRYRLGAEERQGMECFCRLAVRHGILPQDSAIRWAGLQQPAALASET
jgi:predicted solute-binding protein